MAPDGEPPMKPVPPFGEDEFEDQLRRAVAMPDAPESWVRRAVHGFAMRPAIDPDPAVRGLLNRIAAVLSFDSWASPALALGVRAVPSDTRHLLFSSQGRDIDLRITPAPQGYAVAGQILGPDETGVVELSPDADATDASASVRCAPLDELGEFRLEGVNRGTYRLTLRVGRDEIALPPIAVGERPS